MGFRIEGHADFAQSGVDIVCAAVSSAAYMAANTITDVLHVSPDRLYATEGLMEIRLSEIDADGCKTILQGLKLHLLGLEEQYAEYLQVGYMEV